MSGVAAYNTLINQIYIPVTKAQFLKLLDELLELDLGTLRGDELLTNLPRWDSLALIGFIALLDENLGVSVPATKINECKTVADLMALVKDRVT
jgi:acyl carrier protein